MRLPRRHRGFRFGALSALRRMMRAIARGRNREPLEFEQILTRFAVGIVLSVYGLGTGLLGDMQPYMRDALNVLLASAWVLGFGLLAHLTLWPKRIYERRFVSIWGDALAIAGFLHFGGQTAAVFFPVSLWVTLGNGFRFGVPYMYGAMAAHNICFIVMAAITPYWRDAWQFTGGVLVANIAIPLYVAKLIRNLRKAMDDARAASKAKTDFLSMISHELRTPLNAILGLAQLGRLTGKSEQEKSNSSTTELAAGRLLRMVDSILKFQRIESGTAQVVEQPFDPLKMLNEVKAIIEPLALQKGLGFHIRFLSPLPLTISSAADHIQTIILNLVTNAIKYTKKGRVWLEVGVMGSGRSAILRINIRDTGTGIAPEAQSRIFDRFVRAVDHNTSEESGVGLGLSVCRSLVTMLGGAIGCESVHGKGSLFWAEIPVAAQMSASPQLPEATRAPPGDRIVFLSTSEPLSATAKLAASLIGMRVASPDTLLELATAPDAPPRQVIVVDELASSGEGTSVVKKVLNSLPQPPIVIALCADSGVGEENFPDATIFTDPRDMHALTGFVHTSARWRKIVAMEYAEDVSRPALLCRKLSILVADDNDLNTDVMRRMLALDGHSTVIAGTGDAALDIMMRGGIDIVLMDVNMPRLSGIDACKIYRCGLGGNGAIPVVAITADASDATREMCLKAGMTDVVTKPVSLERLREVLAAYAGAARDVPGAQQEPVAAPVAAETPVEESSGAAPPETAPAPASAPQSGQAEGATDSVDATPIFAEGQISQLLQVFGREVFEDQFLKSFKGDVLRNLEWLRQAFVRRQTQAIRDALHAIKSSANTAGARRLAARAAVFENSCPEDASAGMADELQQDYSDYVIQFSGFADGVCVAMPSGTAGMAQALALPEVRRRESAPQPQESAPIRGVRKIT